MFLSIFRSRVKHEHHDGLYQFVQGRVATAGAPSLAFEPLTGNPYYLYTGPGMQAGNPPAQYAGPQVFIAPAVIPSGPGGVLAGELLTAGLLIPDNENTGTI